MSRSQRDQAVRVFMVGNTAQVMLMSLKCGGVGLNLTRANRKPPQFLTSLRSDLSQA
jgi:SNF2 family DNA or RNA helicase